MAEWKPVRIGVRMLAAIVVLQLLNTLLLVGMFVRLGNGLTEQTEPMAPILSPTPVDVTLKPGLEGIFQSVMLPVQAAMTDMGSDPSAMLPTDEQMAAAVASDSLTSPESAVVLDRLRLCYQDMGVPFPKLPGLGETPGDGAPPTTPF